MEVQKQMFQFQADRIMRPEKASAEGRARRYSIDWNTMGTDIGKIADKRLELDK